jgi:hypothetical protein
MTGLYPSQFAKSQFTEDQFTKGIFLKMLNSQLNQVNGNIAEFFKACLIF